MPFLSKTSNSETRAGLTITVILSLVIPTIMPVLMAGSAIGSLGEVKLDKSVVADTGRQEVIASVSHFGRYAITVKSPQGTALQAIDRMAGPSRINGVIGELDGRLDLFLDRGDYKILIYSHEQGSGTVSLEAHTFQEINTPQPPRLEEHRVVHTTLEDFQQRSYWLDIDKRRTVAIEAAGRNLEDLRLWRDGTWLVDAKPKQDILEPHEGRPMRTRRLVALLNPGLYLLAAYGGPSQPWAKSSEDHPLYIRMGIPRLSDAGRRRYVASPFGVDRWLVPRRANYFRLELPEAEPAVIQVNNYHEKRPFSTNGTRREINKQTLPPVAEITTSSRKRGYSLVTIKRQADKEYILQHFEFKRFYPIRGSGDYWLGTIHSGYGGDSVDATSMLIEKPRNRKERLIRSSTVKLNRTTGWRRRFNLLEPLTLFLEVTSGGAYRVIGEGAKARFRVAPFLIRPPRNYKPPDFQPSGYTWNLDPGYYVLGAEPLTKGKVILELSIQAAGLKGEPEAQPASRATTLPRISLDSTSRYLLLLNQQPGVKAGIVLRRLPIDLGTSLPVTQGPGETIEVEVRVPEAGSLLAIAEDGSLLEISVDHGPKRKDHTLKKGTYSVLIVNAAKDFIHYSLVFTPTRLMEESPLPSVSSKALSSLPAFPVLGEERPHYLDVGRGERRTFLVKVDTPALYRLESTGLLETEANLRTRTITSLDRQAKNGVGRNFLIQQYLREGSYQLSFGPRGKTYGHLGIELSRTRLHDCGRLIDGTPARYSLPAGEGLIYRFHIREKRRYRLRSLGLKRSFRMRLEDADGWPLLPPGSSAGFTQEFLPGRYRYVILPQPVDSRVVTLLERIPEKLRFEGHGPHFIPLDYYIEHRWMEPEKGDERIPDQWCFKAPAALDAALQLGREMVGELQRLGPEGKLEKPVSIPGRKKWSGRLEAGDYCLRVKSIRPNNRLDYSVKITSKQLVAGHRRRISAPGDLSISVGKDSLVEISSFGNRDVRGRLYDSAGNLLAQNDDRIDDWNFHIARKLSAGMYRLRVEPIGRDAASTVVSLHLPDEIREQPLSLPASLTITGSDLHTYPLKLPAGKDFLLMAARSRDSVGIALEQKIGDVWQTIGTSIDKRPLLATALATDPLEASYRLRLWSVDRRGAVIGFALSILSLQADTEDRLTGEGVPMMVIEGLDPPLYLAAVRPEKAGLFRLKTHRGTLMWSTGRHRPLKRESSSLVSAGNDLIWFMDRRESGVQKKIQASRVHLSDDQPLQVTVPPGKLSVIDFDPRESGPLMVLAESRLGQPGIDFGVEDEEPRNIRSMGIGFQSAVAVNLRPMEPHVRLWDAGDHGSPLPVNVRQYSYAPSSTEAFSWGINDLSLRVEQARQFDLPSGPKRTCLTLPPATAAIFTRNDRIIRTLWSGDQDTTGTVDSQADQLTLLHAGSHDAHVNVALTPLREGETVSHIDTKTVFKNHFSAAGTQYLTVSVSEREKQTGLHLIIRGSDIAAAYVSKSGRVKHGQEIMVNESGSVKVKHGAGLLVAWLEGRDHGPWDEITRGRLFDVTPPAQVALEGRSMTVRFKRERAAMLHLKTTTPVIAHIRAGEMKPRVEIFPDGANLDCYLPKGISSINLQAAGKGDLSGTAEFLTTDITSIGEGLGPRVRLAPGDSRLFSFLVEQDGKVGVAVRGSADIATCRLLDSNGNQLGQGLVQMHELTRGRYFLAVETPADGFPMEVQPAVVGIRPPDTGPPAEVVLRYLEMSGITYEGKKKAR